MIMNFQFSITLFNLLRHFRADKFLEKEALSDYTEQESSNKIASYNHKQYWGKKTNPASSIRFLDLA